MVLTTLDISLTIAVLAFWFFFPVGIFLSLAHLDKIREQILRLDEIPR